VLAVRNFNLLDGNKVQLPSGVFAGVESYVCYPDGELEGIRLSEKNMLVTHAGELVPVYTETHRRKVKYSVEFFRNGMIKAVALDEQQEIQTPIGEFPAELITFFETGELNRFFPLDGKISGLWSEEEEKKLAIPFSFDLSFTKFTAVITSIGFYKNGNIRSITLFPGETIIIQTGYGEIFVKGGFSLYESGEIESLEPLNQAQIQTPIGVISCFDPNAIGVNADSNSLVFDKQGRVISLVTASNRIAVQTEDERFLTFTPREVVNPLNNETMMTEGLPISFDYAEGTVSFGESGGKSTFSVGGNGFTVIEYNSSIYMCSPEDCAGCSLGCK
jgi:antitoxin component YwqK of YwqJK toxin-antitoxin module